MGALARRGCALVVALAMLLSVPLAVPRACSECPVQCPMHLHRSKAAKQLPCHHGSTTKSQLPDGPCLRQGACGHVQTAIPGALPAVLPAAVAITLPVVTETVASDPITPRTIAAPAPPTGPPRRVAA